MQEIFTASPERESSAVACARDKDTVKKCNRLYESDSAKDGLHPEPVLSLYSMRNDVLYIFHKKFQQSQLKEYTSKERACKPAKGPGQLFK